MQGMDATSFGPDLVTNRAMIVTILYRIAGSPAVDGDNPFDDVGAGQYYTDAVQWAAKNGIVSGYSSDSFGPADSITREQLAVMLYRYAGSPASQNTLDSFTDGDKVSNFALEALKWAVDQGIISGK